eukprot:scaffold108243_cov49-Phaeocystis_antarctica.AAC.1
MRDRRSRTRRSPRGAPVASRPSRRRSSSETSPSPRSPRHVAPSSRKKDQRCACVRIGGPGCGE